MMKIGVSNSREFKYVSLFIIVCTISSIVMYVAYGINPLLSWRILLGFSYLLFLPGFVLCWMMFPDDSEIDSVERLGLSVGLSIPLVLAVVLAADAVFKVPVTPLNIILSVGVALLALVLLGAAARVFRRGKSKKAS